MAFAWLESYCMHRSNPYFISEEKIVVNAILYNYIIQRELVFEKIVLFKFYCFHSHHLVISFLLNSKKKERSSQRN